MGRVLVTPPAPKPSPELEAGDGGAGTLPAHRDGAGAHPAALRGGGGSPGVTGISRGFAPQQSLLAQPPLLPKAGGSLAAPLHHLRCHPPLQREGPPPLDHPNPGPPTPPPSVPVPKQRPHLHCDLSYSPAEATLTMMVLGLSHLPKGLRGGRGSYIKVYLLPRLPASQRVSLQRGGLHPAHREPCRFGRYSLEELRSFTLRFAVYTRFGGLKDSFVREVLFPCSQATWDPQEPCSYSRELSRTKTKLRKRLGAHHVSPGALSSPPRSLGQLFLLLQYQALASHIKVLVCKAENLGRLSRMLGTPGHYVITQLYHNSRIINTKETKSITSYNPVWNTPFLFNLPAGDIQQEELALEFTIMQARIYTRSSPLGRVQVGPRAPEAGLLHWREMCSRGQLESARWHCIQPKVLGP